MEFCDDDRHYIRPTRPPVRPAAEAYNALLKQYGATADDVMTRWKSGQLSAGEAWGLLPCHPHPAGPTTAYISEVRYGIPINHSLWELYQAVVQESGGNTSGDYNYIRTDWASRNLSKYSERKNAEAEALRTLHQASLDENKRLQERETHRRTRWTQEDEDEERQVRILARAIRLARDMV